MTRISPHQVIQPLDDTGDIVIVDESTGCEIIITGDHVPDAMHAILVIHQGNTAVHSGGGYDQRDADDDDELVGR